MANLSIAHHKENWMALTHKRIANLSKTASLPIFNPNKPPRSYSTDDVPTTHQTTHFLTPTCSSSKPHRPSRFGEDFEDLGPLGHGGFGVVFKSRNRLDGTNYAMKKITFRKTKNSSKRLEKVLREVKALAKLDHPNVVRYYQSWIEEEAFDPLSRKSSKNRKLTVSRESNTFSSAEDLEDDEDDFSEETILNLLPNKFSPPSVIPLKPKLSLEDTDIEWDLDTDTTTTTEGTNDDFSASPSPPCRRFNEHSEDTWANLKKLIQRDVQPMCSTILYIQMQLCENTLQSWLESRSSVDKIASLCIFRQICKGLKYIHSEGIIHRDLKPANIFLVHKPALPGNLETVVIGDFGLAVARETSLTSSTDSLLADEEPPSTTDEHTSGVGTLIYSSPEQRSGRSYNEKTDIYSLGILFFELFYCFSTKMERARVLTNLRNHVLPADFLKENPKESAFLLMLIAPEPEDRPSVEQVLKSDVLSSDSVSISRARWDEVNEKMKSQDLLIEEQKRQIAELQEKLKMLQHQ